MTYTHTHTHTHTHTRTHTRTHTGTLLTIPSLTLDVGRVTCIENNHREVPTAKKGLSVSIKISNDRLEERKENLLSLPPSFSLSVSVSVFD
jgi:hypothetical protein